MKNYLLFALFGLIAGVTLKPMPAVAICAVIAALYFFYLSFSEAQQRAREGSKEIRESDELLRQELTKAHQLVLSKLNTADDELKNKVINLLIEAGKHLGNPVTNSRLVYGPEFFIKWNRDGLDLVAEVRKLTEEYAARTTAQ
jgi:hypothetical protein